MKPKLNRARTIRHAWLTGLIVEVHQAARGAYGVRREHAELRLGRGIVVGHGAIELLMRRAGLAGVTGRPNGAMPSPTRSPPTWCSTSSSTLLVAERCASSTSHPSSWRKIR